MEQELVTKVEELMLTLDSAREYGEIAKAMIDSLLFILAIISSALFVILSLNMLQLFGHIPYFFLFLISICDIYIILFAVSNNSTRSFYWKTKGFT